MKGTHKPLATTGFAALLGVAAALPMPLYAEGMKPEERREQLQEAQDTLQEAAKVVNEMKRDPDVVAAMQRAKGVFLVPNYGRAALGVGGAGGEGVLVTRSNGDWDSPMFYNMGSINAGLEAGVEAGQIAMLLMTDEALQTFLQEHNFSLNADAGLTVVDWSARAQASAGKGDIVMWSDTEGLFGDLAISVQDIVWDDEENKAFYGRDVDPKLAMQANVKPVQPDRTLVVILP